MSMILTMTTAAIIAGFTLSEFSLAAICANTKDTELDQGMETIFADADLMIQTLENMDCHVKQISENEILVETVCGVLRYARPQAGMAFRLYLTDVKDAQGLIENIRSFEVDYGRNIQEYTYHHIKEHLSEGMSIESEDFEGDDLYITINVED